MSASRSSTVALTVVPSFGHHARPDPRGRDVVVELVLDVDTCPASAPPSSAWTAPLPADLAGRCRRRTARGRGTEGRTDLADWLSVTRLGEARAVQALDCGVSGRAPTAWIRGRRERRRRAAIRGRTGRAAARAGRGARPPQDRRSRDGAGRQRVRGQEGHEHDPHCVHGRARSHRRRTGGQSCPSGRERHGPGGCSRRSVAEKTRAPQAARAVGLSCRCPSKGPHRPPSPSSNRPGSSWRSTSRPPGPSASRSHRRCWRGRIGSSSEAAAAPCAPHTLRGLGRRSIPCEVMTAIGEPQADPQPCMKPARSAEDTPRST